ncbi:hypothetical protein [Candidatus Pantoea edessiphila]|uniref:hypothetical protein n=1 Tax=Candidatus Pantoea edessiphila TaxID=2044610 RepID=UPI001F544B66
MGLGDIYLGSPYAVAIDPRHRLLSSKYSPSKNFTNEGAELVLEVRIYVFTVWILLEDIN